MHNYPSPIVGLLRWQHVLIESSVQTNISEWLERGNRSVYHEDRLPTVCGDPEAKLPPPTKAGVRTSKQNHILKSQAAVILLQGGTLQA